MDGDGDDGLFSFGIFFPRVIWNAEASSALEGSFFNNAFLRCSYKEQIL